MPISRPPRGQRLGQRARRTQLMGNGLSLLGIFAGLYATEVRDGIEWGGPLALKAAGAVAISLGSVFLFNRALPRKVYPTKVEHPAVRIDQRTQSHMPDDEQVLGRELHMLESEQSTDELYVFLPGLGLDAYDFEPFMRQSRVHCIALTLFGFNADERDDRNYSPISLEGHLKVISFALRHIRSEIPRKKITLCGFSIGADQLLLLAEQSPEVLREVEVSRAVLLDVNVNQSTTILSEGLARIDPDLGVEQLNGLTEGRGDREDFHFLSNYKSRICLKNLHHLRRLAGEIAGAWEVEDTRRFLDRLKALREGVGDVTVVMSSSYRELCQTLSRGVRDEVEIEYEQQLNHFQLLKPDVLDRHLNPRPKR